MSKSKSICFIGLDGSGKSTSISFAEKWLDQNHVIFKTVRAAYVIEKSMWLIKLGKKLVLRKHSNPYKKNDYSNYLVELRKTNVKSFKYKIFTLITTLEFKNQIRNRVSKNLKHGTNLVIDRYIYDNAVTYAANLGLGSDYMLGCIEKKWKHAPRPDYIVYVKTPVDVCLSRKNDIPDPLYLKVREPLYDIIAKEYNAFVIDGSISLDDLKKTVFDLMEVFFHGK